MKKHIHAVAFLGVLTLLGMVVIPNLGLSATTASDCVGKPYGFPGCPVKSVSSSSVPATCGNGVLDTAEECDLGKARNGLTNCTSGCKLLFCGDGTISPSLAEECEPDTEEVYVKDPATGELTTEIHYLSPSCGVVCTVPTCDNENNCNGGCKRKFNPACPASKASASSLNSTMLVSSANVTPVPSAARAPVASAICGNGTTDAGEQCDDANQINTDNCTNNCRLPICGDAFVQPWEQCDDGNSVDTDSCSNKCKLPACGDGIVESGEECDDANQINADNCTNQCKLPKCGDAIIQPGEECDNGLNNSNASGAHCHTTCKLPKCGDGVMDMGEECDDGNATNDDACSNQCKFPRCGDGVIQASEECDDGNRVNNDDCNNLCRLAACGNGIREAAEACDDGNQSNNDSCTNECKKPLCGDGFVQPGEYCDHGQSNGVDGLCDTTCRVPSCGDGIVQSGEECDNGRNNSDTLPNSCRTSCRKAVCGDQVVDKGELCDGIKDCAPDCSAVLKSSAPVQTLPPFTLYGIALATFGSFGVIAYILRKRLHSLISKFAGEKVAQSLDDIPLDEIEMPWHKW